MVKELVRSAFSFKYKSSVSMPSLPYISYLCTCLSLSLKKYLLGGMWVAQSVKHLMIHGFKPCIRLLADSAEPTWDFLSLPLSLPLPYSLSLKISKHKKKKDSTHLLSLYNVFSFTFPPLYYHNTSLTCFYGQYHMVL